jgi:hypothetical protein
MEERSNQKAAVIALMKRPKGVTLAETHRLETPHRGGLCQHPH